MKRSILGTAFMLVLLGTAFAADQQAPDSNQRMSDLESYINNAARGSDAPNTGVTSRVGAPGPGHNAWLMVSSAFVLFMALPGLALFYGGVETVGLDLAEHGEEGYHG
jgi:hypothetical protein